MSDSDFFYEMVSDAVGTKVLGKKTREHYRRYLQSKAWKTKRKVVLQAAGFRSRRCRAPAIEAHHETYKRIHSISLKKHGNPKRTQIIVKSENKLHL